MHHEMKKLTANRQRMTSLMDGQSGGEKEGPRRGVLFDIYENAGGSWNPLTQKFDLILQFLQLTI
jgi:hypothetical protein